MLKDKSNFYQEGNKYSLADELLEQTEIKICKVNHVLDFFPGIKPILSPLTEEAMRAANEHRYFLPVRYIKKFIMIIE